MDQIIEAFTTVAASTQMRVIAKAIAILAVGFFIARLLHQYIPVRRFHPQHQLIVRRIVKYVILGVSVAWALQILGFSLGLLLGTAGILTVAIGFAAQTSTSNLISGIFLMAEQPFLIGDIVKVSDTTGEVVSVDWLSVRLRTFDNLLVRIPNETMLKSHVTNLTHYPIRRLDMKIGVAYKEDLTKVRRVLEGVADKNPICLEEPKPLIIILGYGESSIDLQFSVWAARANYLELRNSMHESVKRAFDQEGIEIPFPHRTVYTGSVTSPFPIRIASHEGDANEMRPG
jgi:small-conductance mechanosensitive channel